MSLILKTDSTALAQASSSTDLSSRADPNELETKIGQALVKWMTEIHTRSIENKAKASTEPQYIRQGMWYPSEYFQALNKFKNVAVKLSTWLVEKKAYTCGYLDIKFFERVETPLTSNKFSNFRIKSGVLPSEALKAAKQGLSIIECGTALKIAQYGALLDVLGERKFNILFGCSSKGQKMNLGYIGDQPLDLLLINSPPVEEFIYRKTHNMNPEKAVGSIGNRPVTVGQCVYMKNVTNYAKKHPHSEYGGFNLICSDDTPGQQRFVGFGFEGTEEELTHLFLERYNRQFSWDEIHPSFKTEPHFLQRHFFANQLVHDERKSLDIVQGEGFHPESTRTFNISLIQDLIDLPEEKIGIDFMITKIPGMIETLAKLQSEIVFNVSNEHTETVPEDTHEHTETSSEDTQKKKRIKLEAGTT